MHFKEWLDPLRHNKNDPQDIFWIGIDPYVEPPKPNEKWYRGHPHNNSRIHGPLWLTRSKEDALFYGNVGTYQISPNIKLGTYKDLVRAVRESEAKRDEIKPNSGFDGHNDNDFVYIPKVQKKLKQMNIDALLIKDVMANYEIDALVVLNKSTIEIQWTENDQEHAQALKQTGFWGRKGAGAIIAARDTGRILLPHRSQSVEQPGTWGVWGGAIDPKENPETAARREVHEEAGAPDIEEMIPLHVFKKDDFQYHNFLAITPQEFKPKLNWETQGYKWINYGEWPQPMHFGLESLIQNSGKEIKKKVNAPTP